MRNIFNYVDRPSPVHRLTGATKLACLLLWSFAAMLGFDPRLLAFMSVAGIALFWISKIRLRDVSFMLGFTGSFMLLNNILIFVFSPEHGVTLYGARHVICELPGGLALTQEQLYYQLNVVLKYIAMIPVVLLFVCTTNPSEFAASLNRIGLSYKVAYSVSLALRYIPDVQREYRDISLSQQARGVELSGKLSQRIKNAAHIIFPLIMSSMDRIEQISNAMELRGFGKLKKRSWYNARPFTKADYLSIAGCVALLAASIALMVMDGGRFYNPFA